MNMDVFSQTVKAAVETYLGKDVSVAINKITKNNGLVLTCVTIANNKINMAPNIYLDGYLTDYNNGKSMTLIIDDILNVYKSSKQAIDFDNSIVTDFNKASSKICCKLINAEKNKDFLNNVPHKLIKDLAIIFYIVVDENDDGNYVIVIKNNIFNNWNITLEHLYELAFNNTMRLYKEDIFTMSELIQDITGDDSIIKEEDCPMFIVTNNCKINGAIVMLYDGLMKRFSEKIGKSFYIIPSSIHETMFIPYDENIDTNIIRNMVYDVNRTAVSKAEYLSDNIYYYDADTNNFDII